MQVLSCLPPDSRLILLSKYPYQVPSGKPFSVSSGVVMLPDSLVDCICRLLT